jgi:K+-sensing histidine kinase KdpD
MILLAKIQTGTLRLRPEPIALRRLLERAIEQLPAEQRDACLLAGGDPFVQVDAVYGRHALGLLLQHLSADATAPTTIHIEATTCTQIWFGGHNDTDLADPLARLDQLPAATDPSRGRQAADLLRLVLSRALIELHGGTWTVEDRSDAGPALCLTLPLADPDADAD